MMQAAVACPNRPRRRRRLTSGSIIKKNVNSCSVPYFEVKINLQVFCVGQIFEPNSTNSSDIGCSEDAQEFLQKERYVETDRVVLWGSSLVIGSCLRLIFSSFPVEDSPQVCFSQVWTKDNAVELDVKELEMHMQQI